MSVAPSHTVIGPFRAATETEERDWLDRFFGIRNYTVADEAVTRLKNGRMIHVLNVNAWDNVFFTVLFDISHDGKPLPSGVSIRQDNSIFQAPAAVIGDSLVLNGSPADVTTPSRRS